MCVRVEETLDRPARGGGTGNRSIESVGQHWGDRQEGRKGWGAGGLEARTQAVVQSHRISENASTGAQATPRTLPGGRLLDGAGHRLRPPGREGAEEAVGDGGGGGDGGAAKRLQ